MLITTLEARCWPPMAYAVPTMVALLIHALHTYS